MVIATNAFAPLAFDTSWKSAREPLHEITSVKLFSSFPLLQDYTTILFNLSWGVGECWKPAKDGRDEAYKSTLQELSNRKSP